MEQFERNLPKEPHETALHIAARCWCDPETEMVEMDSRLALAFAKRVHAMLELIRIYSHSEPLDFAQERE